jgi:hypothetical protein
MQQLADRFGVTKGAMSMRLSKVKQRPHVDAVTTGPMKNRVPALYSLATLSRLEEEEEAKRLAAENSRAVSAVDKLTPLAKRLARQDEGISGGR